MTPNPKVIEMRKPLTPDSFMERRRKASPQETKPADSKSAEDGPEKDAASKTSPQDGVRRVTGSADIPLSPEGKEQAKQMAASLSRKFDWVLTSPEKRAVETAKAFGDPYIIQGLDAWRRGAIESQPVDKVKEIIRKLMLNPKQKPPGKSPISGEPGESLDDFAKHLLSTIQVIRAVIQKGQCGLIVSHGGNLQTINAWAEAGFPEDLSFDHKAMSAKPYWSVVGRLYLLGDKALDEVKDDDKDGLYMIEHGSTAYNRDKKS